ncbi:MAG TPA: hypothetical protein VEG64_16925 [Candidatus Sulfotelmatobacter sp.]|nr:hypothetical protein [Candidatus Sulfotelmatobacter sp.]
MKNAISNDPHTGTTKEPPYYTVREEIAFAWLAEQQWRDAVKKTNQLLDTLGISFHVRHRKVVRPDATDAFLVRYTKRLLAECEKELEKNG